MVELQLPTVFRLYGVAERVARDCRIVIA